MKICFRIPRCRNIILKALNRLKRVKICLEKVSDHRSQTQHLTAKIFSEMNVRLHHTNHHSTINFDISSFTTFVPHRIILIIKVERIVLYLGPDMDGWLPLPPERLLQWTGAQCRGIKVNIQHLFLRHTISKPKIITVRKYSKNLNSKLTSYIIWFSGCSDLWWYIFSYLDGTLAIFNWYIINIRVLKYKSKSFAFEKQSLLCSLRKKFAIALRQVLSECDKYVFIWK